jgi:hypothetical protein
MADNRCSEKKPSAAPPAPVILPGTVLEICNDGLHILFAVEGRKWRVPIPEAKFGRKEGEYVA